MHLLRDERAQVGHHRRGHREDVWTQQRNIDTEAQRLVAPPRVQGGLRIVEVLLRGVVQYRELFRSSLFEYQRRQFGHQLLFDAWFRRRFVKRHPESHSPPVNVRSLRTKGNGRRHSLSPNAVVLITLITLGSGTVTGVNKVYSIGDFFRTRCPRCNAVRNCSDEHDEPRRFPRPSGLPTWPASASADMA